jgi:hypothetical protein
MSRWRRKPKVDRQRFPHDYTGPTTRWGLREGSPCIIIGSRSGGKRIRTQDGRVWVIAANQVRVAPREAVTKKQGSAA